MGILRADRITGLGGANAIKGSVEFRAAQNIHVEIVNGNADFNYGSGDFTIECWWNSGGDLSTDINFVTLWNYASDRQAWGMYWDADDGNFGLIASSTGSIGSGDLGYRQAAGFEKNKWYHLAIVRISNTLTLYKNGTSIGSNSSFTGTIYENTVDPLIIGGQMSGTDETNKIMRGFISNLRIIKGEGIYTGNFTPPTNELTVTPNTVLLACQSPGNILQEATGKTLVAYRSTTNSAFPVASRFTPNSPVGFSTTTDVGSQYGSTFDGFGNFATSTYMVPPGGNTRERNRGRALFGGGSTIDNTIQSLNIQSQGNAEDFGDLSTGRYETECASSSTRGIWGGGYTESPNVKVDVVEFVTIANSSNTTDFGNLTVARGHLAGMCNSTRGVFANGSTDPGPNVNTLDYITIATAGNATDFGDSTTASKPMGGGRSSTTRGIFTLGNAPSAVNNIEYITIASTGDSQDFGDLTGFSGWGKGAGNISSGTRAILVGGHEALNNIEYITIASLGNGTDFGDLIVGRRSAFTAGSKTRGVIAGGKNPSQINNIEYITIAATGNSLDFGDLLNKKSFSSGLSDCHGGLS